MKLALTAFATMLVLSFTVDAAWSKGGGHAGGGGRSYVAGHSGGTTSHASSGGYGGLHHGVHGYRGRRGGGMGGEEETQTYVPQTPNYVQSNGNGYWEQDKYSGNNPVNMVYH